ncbi:MAG: polyisoprenyl-phosphate glycosyltransferase, partial [Gaiellaceae bacterium]|nr:polyisoprenyl-phosphate glycosyltransferase [Gaiellaceae bacterium]
AVLGEREATRRLSGTHDLLARDDVDYVSIKVSATVAPHSPWAFDADVTHVVERLTPLFERAAAATPAVRYRTYDGKTLPFADQSFDLAFAVNVFHHVDPPDRAALAAELARVVRPGGIVAVFEHNPLNPLTRLVVSRCEFDAGVELLSTREVSALLTRAGLQPVERRYILFFPWRAAFLQRLEARLGPVPLGAQHLTAARRSD